ncbi:uracil-DNA glycosylase [Lentzea sp. NBRC 105346]|uniref:UdgX family uracil-DNA binding protein n=1 Tax=Lentzea sp. NBRC 105346 TaxID=3032205 RepID=UPI0024A1EC93|nr:UdgX family uracil-DNA binding protein [Lentzea sp. NBRC 105346]GLZ33628.1 uracil-DNA glycosylase [Lentzea sp. NBRC 105346]
MTSTARSAAEFVPAGADLAALRSAACGCRGCDLYQGAIQTVFGEGSPDARVMMVGEQPGDQEDRKGHPFVGPAGRLLDKALAEANIDRGQVYVTNAVKHFKFTERGKRRIHQTPKRTEVLACLPWLEAELSRVKPDLVVCLGAVAAKALMGSSFKLTEHRGEVLLREDYRLIVTVHPSAVLRAPDRDAAYREFVDDLVSVREAMK